MSQKPEPLSNIDAAWLSMDDPTNLMMITGVMTFKKSLNMDHLMAIVHHRWLKFDRFRQRINKPSLPLGTPHWEFDPHFDVRAHIHRVALPAPGNQAALQQMVSDLMSSPLDPSKPLWQIHVVENYQGGSAIIPRIHHSIADGMALVYVLLSLTDMTPDAPWPDSPAEIPTKNKNKSGGGLFRGVGSLVKQTSSTVRSAGHLVQGGWDIVSNSERTFEVLQMGADASYAASKLVLRTSDPQTPFKGALGVTKRGAWSRPLPLRDIKAIKKSTRTTVNDVLVSAMSGAVRRYLIEKGADTEDFRAVIPVNMRKPEEMEEMGNKFGLVFLKLPVSIADPLERLDEVNRRMTQLKESAEAPVTLGILNAMGISPAEIQGMILRIFAAKATAVLTNVPGPPIPLFLAGAEIENIMFWVPQSGWLGLGISILSYAGNVFLGVASDAGLVPDPELIIDGFYEEYDLLMGLLNLKQTPQRTVPTPSAPKSKKQPAPARVDDLTRINGVGPKVAAVLQAQGITAYSQLANTDEEKLQGILAEAGKQYQKIDPASWPNQARYLASINSA